MRMRPWPRGKGSSTSRKNISWDKEVKVIGRGRLVVLSFDTETSHIELALSLDSAKDIAREMINYADYIEAIEQEMDRRGLMRGAG